ncbi:MAG: hypothetical protein AAF197_00300, partial [Pseudomonadota bacterium]
MKIKIFLLLVVSLFLTACGSNKKDVSLQVLSDPLGAYAMIQVSYENEEDSEWIFLGPTPVEIQKTVSFDNAKTVSLKVIRQGFFDQVKTWKARDPLANTWPAGVGEYSGAQVF